MPAFPEGHRQRRQAISLAPDAVHPRHSVKWSSAAIGIASHAMGLPSLARPTGYETFQRRVCEGHCEEAWSTLKGIAGRLVSSIGKQCGPPPTESMLDYTNVISNAIKPQPSASLIDWMAYQRDEDLFVASLTIAEIRRGIPELPSGRRKDALDVRFAGNDGPQSLFAGRVPSFDDGVGLISARLMAEGKAAGRPRSAVDMILAAVAEANHCMMVTDNEWDFRGLQIFNPLRKEAEKEWQ